MYRLQPSVLHKKAIPHNSIYSYIKTLGPSTVPARFPMSIRWLQILPLIFHLLCVISRIFERAVQYITEWMVEYTMFVTGEDNSVLTEEHFLWTNHGTTVRLMDQHTFHLHLIQYGKEQIRTLLFTPVLWDLL